MLGVRCGDIVSLKMSNFDWGAKKLRFVQHKTKRPIELPLPKEVGWAVIDYIRRGRPEFAKTDFVFVTHRTPYDAFSKGSSLTVMLENRRRDAGIPKGNMHRGFHSLRHAAANGYLELGTPLPAIAEILGHADMRTTAIYLKRDLKKLAECVLDPEELKNEEED